MGYYGDPLRAFTATFGAPFRNLGGSVDFAKCPGHSAVGRWNVSVEQGRVTMITRNACEGEKLAVADAARDAQQFMPTDAAAPTRRIGVAP
jgi:hypothetical protein